MMRKSLKNKILYVMICFCLLMFSCFIFSLNATVAKADSGFVMMGGASVRMDTPSGIKYQATISESAYDAEAEYGILIVPTDYLTKHNIQDQYIEKLTDAGYKNLAIVETLPVKQDDGSYLLTGSIVNIYESNFNREFTGIAFSVKDGVYTYATANDNSRSIMQVASRYLTATVNPPSDDQKTTLLDMIGGKRASDENVNFALNENGDYVSKIKFDAFLPTPDDNFTVALMPKETADYAKFTLSTSSSFEGVVRADLGNDWYSFTFDTQMITDYTTVNGTRSDVITSIDITNASENVIIANVRNSILEIAKYSDSYVGSANYFATEMSDAYDYDGDNYSIKVTAKAHSDNIGSDVRATHAAIYIPFGKEMVTDSVTVTWKAKIDKTSFNGAYASSIDYTRFYKSGMLTNDSTFFGANSATSTYSVEDSNGWTSYTLNIPKSELAKFFVEKDGSVYFKTVCMNTQAVLVNNGQWVAATNTSYVFYVDEVEFVCGEFVGAYVGNGKYLAVSYSNDANFVTGSDGHSLKVTANAVAFGAVDGSGATGRMANLAVYLPYGSSMPTTSVTVTWKTKIDRNSFVDCDDTQGANFSNLNTNSENFIKAAMLSVDTAAYSAHPNSTISLPSAEVNGWYNYTLTISESELSTFFVQGTDGNYYLRLVCINTVPPLSNGQGTGSWAAASTMGYDFYVDELKFTAN